MSREETMTAAVAAFGDLADENGIWRGGVLNFTRQIASIVGVHEYTVRHMLPTLRDLGVIKGPLPARRGGRGGLQNYEWQLLRPGAAIVKTESGFYAVGEVSSE